MDGNMATTIDITGRITQVFMRVVDVLHMRSCVHVTV